MQPLQIVAGDTRLQQQLVYCIMQTITSTGFNLDGPVVNFIG